MLCDVCREKEATVQLTQVVKGEVALLHLCPRCAAERGVETTMAVPQKNLLGDFLHQVQAQSHVASLEALECASCGMTMRDFRSTGRVGCANCYVTFDHSLRELLRRVHGSAKHVGRVYEPPALDLSPRDSEAGVLRDRLRRAIQNEEFELAASLRDQLKGME